MSSVPIAARRSVVMRVLILRAALVAGLGVTTVASETYKVTVTRVDKDLYRVEDNRPKLYIETRYCYEYANREEAILKYERSSSDNKLIFDSGTSCDVKALR